MEENNTIFLEENDHGRKLLRHHIYNDWKTKLDFYVSCLMFLIFTWLSGNKLNKLVIVHNNGQNVWVMFYNLDSNIMSNVKTYFRYWPLCKFNLCLYRQLGKNQTHYVRYRNPVFCFLIVWQTITKQYAFCSQPSSPLKRLESQNDKTTVSLATAEPGPIKFTFLLPAHIESGRAPRRLFH